MNLKQIDSSGLSILEVLIALSLSMMMLSSTQATNSSLRKLLHRLESQDRQTLRTKNSASSRSSELCEEQKVITKALVFRTCREGNSLGTNWSFAK